MDTVVIPLVAMLFFSPNVPSVPVQSLDPFYVTQTEYSGSVKKQAAYNIHSGKVIKKVSQRAIEKSPALVPIELVSPTQQPTPPISATPTPKPVFSVLTPEPTIILPEPTIIGPSPCPPYWDSLMQADGNKLREVILCPLEEASM